MNRLFKTILCGLIISTSTLMAQDLVFEQELGGEFNDKLPNKDFSKEFTSEDGTLAFAYIPSHTFPIPFNSFVTYLTPISKKVAIIEASKIENSSELCLSSKRHFEKEFSEQSFSRFLTIEQLKEKGFSLNNPPTQSGIDIRFDPNTNHTLQFGCIDSTTEQGKFAFIVSVSDGNLKNVASQERDKLVATKNNKR